MTTAVNKWKGGFFVCFYHSLSTCFIKSLPKEPRKLYNRLINFGFDTLVKKPIN